MRRSLTSLSKILLVGASLFLLGCTETPKSNIPTLTGRVVDNAGVLSTSEKKSLSGYLADVDKETKAEIIVLTMESLPEDENLEEYTNKVFNAWRIGKRDSDSGLLFVLVTGTRKIRIEVGRGNEGNMPDMIANRIAKEQMAPRFKEGKFYLGFMDAASESVKYIKKGN